MLWQCTAAFNLLQITAPTSGALLLRSGQRQLSSNQIKFGKRPSYLPEFQIKMVQPLGLLA